MDQETQNAKILEHLKQGNTITQLEALERFSCIRLAARIHNLKKRGIAICSRTITQGKKHFSEYFIDNGQPSELHSRDRYATTEKLMQQLSNGR